MIYHANLRLPKKPCTTRTGRCYTQEVIDSLVANIDATTGYHVVEITNSETEDIIKIEIDTELTSNIMFDSLGGMDI